MINIKRDTSNPPICLANEKQKELAGSKGNYRCGDVVKRIKEDFYRKCYICESSNPTSINVEHFLPHQGKNIDLKFDFANLFYACQHCNNCKSDQFKNILNCTDSTEDVENWIELRVEPIPSSKIEIQITPKGENSGRKAKIVETIKLLEKVYNGEHTAIKTEESANLRDSLIEEIFLFYQQVMKYSKNSHPDRQKEFEDSIKDNIRNDSKLTGFKRWIIRRNENMKKFESSF